MRHPLAIVEVTPVTELEELRTYRLQIQARALGELPVKSPKPPQPQEPDRNIYYGLPKAMPPGTWKTLEQAAVDDLRKRADKYLEDLSFFPAGLAGEWEQL